MNEFNIDGFLDQFAPFLLSLRNVDGYKIIDVEVPNNWDVGKLVRELTPDSKNVQTVLTEQDDQNKLIAMLTTQIFEVNGKTTFKEEFVTCGGIKLSEIDPNSMQSKKVEHLFFGGEVMDIDGVTGGFNFQNAWTTGFIAAQSISSKSVNSSTTDMKRVTMYFS